MVHLMWLYVTLINLTDNGNVSFYCYERVIFLCLRVFKSLTFDKLKEIVCGYKTIKNVLFVYDKY